MKNGKNFFVAETYTGCTGAHILPPQLVRAKGFLQQQDSLYLFSWVMGKWELKPVSLVKDCADLVNKIVFIAHPQVLEQLALVAGRQSMLLHISSFDPMATQSASVHQPD